MTSVMVIGQKPMPVMAVGQNIVVVEQNIMLVVAMTQKMCQRSVWLGLW